MCYCSELLQDFGFSEVIAPLTPLIDKNEEVKIKALILKREHLQMHSSPNPYLSNGETISINKNRILKEGDFVFCGSRYGGQKNAGFLLITKELINQSSLPIVPEKYMFIIRGSEQAKGLAYLDFALSNYPLTLPDFIGKLEKRLIYQQKSKNDFAFDCKQLFLHLKNWQKNINNTIKLIYHLESE